MAESISTSIPNFILRFAKEKDLPVVLQFIKDLAEYEKLSHQVVANEKLIKKYLFSEKPYAEVLLAEKEGEPVAFALFFHNFSTFMGRPGIYLEDLFVKPEQRGQGFGTELLKFLAKLAVERECGRFEWSVLDWNEPAINFYDSIGAKPVEGWTRYRLKGEALERVAWSNSE